MMKLKKVLISFVPLLVFDQLFWRFVFDEPRTIIESAVSGFLVSLLWLIPTKSNKKLEDLMLRESRVELSADEKLLIATTANRIEENERIGGKLFLTGRRLVFVLNKPHQENRQEFDRSQIASVKQHPELPKAIVVTTMQNTTHVFNVNRYSEWIKNLA